MARLKFGSKSSHSLDLSSVLSRPLWTDDLHPSPYNIPSGGRDV
jgi:hypothetical protein